LTRRSLPRSGAGAVFIFRSTPLTVTSPRSLQRRFGQSRLSPAKTAELLQRGYQAHKRGEIPRALRCYARVLEQQPTHPFAIHHAALAARQISTLRKANGLPGIDDEAMRLIAASIAVAPENPIALHNFAKFKHDRGELEEARHLYQHALVLKPDQGESWTNLGNVWGELGDRGMAEWCWERAIASPTGAEDGRFNLSFLKLLKGDFVEGWRDYEARWQTAEFLHNYGRPDLEAAAPRWTGGPVNGTLLLHAEQGLGDAIMMLRYVPLAEQLAENSVLLEVHAPLVELARYAYPMCDVVARGEPLPPFQAQLSMMSLPAVLQTSIETIPAPMQIPALAFAPDRGRVGICWKGSSTHVNDRTRSLPFPLLAPLLEAPGFHWQSLQLGEPTYDSRRRARSRAASS
jgi:tetratricopeptide (TPR) repeat protein